ENLIRARVDARRRRLVDRALANVTDDADDREVIGVAEGDCLPDRTTPRKIFLGQRLIDHERDRRALTILRRQVASGETRKNHRERHLGDDERVTQTARSASTAAGSLAQRLLELGARRTNRGHQTERNTGQQRNRRGESEHTIIETHGLGARQLPGRELDEYA